jgi:Cysteine-rich CPCC
VIGTLAPVLAPKSEPPGKLFAVHPCPCCGYRTLPDRGIFYSCPVCRWEDEGVHPWEISEPNGQTLVEAQQAFLAQRLPYRLRPGKVRAPRRGEERGPDWRPLELTPQLMERVERAHAEWRRWLEEEERQAAAELADDPEGPFKEYNAAIQALRSEAPRLSHDEVEARFRELSQAQRMPFPDAEIELLSRLIKDEDYYHRHPLRSAWWLLRYARPKTFARRWEELRTGSVRVAG